MHGDYFRIHEPSVIYQIFDEELVAVHLTTGTYHTLPGLAGEVLLLFGSAGASLASVAEALAAKYDAPGEVIARDLESFVRELVGHSVVVATEPYPGTLPAPVSLAHKLPYSAPRVESFSDLQELFLLDPVHDVGAAGWPNAAPVAAEAVMESVASLRCRLAGPQVIFEQFPNETVAMHLGTGAYHSLSGAAQDIFLLLPNEPTTSEIRRALAAKYVVEAAELDAAVREYVDQLARGGLIVVETVADDTPERELMLSHAGVGEVFSRPTLETFAQPSFESDPHLFTETVHAETARTAEVLPGKRYTLRAHDLLYSEASGEFVVSDRDLGRYYKLNAAASDVFRMFEHSADVAEVVAKLRRKYVVPEQDLRVAVMILVANLRKLGLVVLGGGEASEMEAAGGDAPVEAFEGFDVAVHHDLEELLRPFNPAIVGERKQSAAQVQMFLELMDEYFQEAVEAFGVRDSTYAVGGRGLTIRCACSGQSEQLTLAMEHLIAETAAEGLTIHVWDSATVPPGPLLGALLERLYENWLDHCGPRGEFLGFHGGAVSAIFHPGPDVLSVVDTASGRAYYLLRDDSPLPFWELSSPFRHIFHPWFNTMNLQYTHAAAVGNADGGVLLVGKGGSGKSSTALLCASAGMQYAGDDYCLTEAETPWVHSLYDTAKLKGIEDLERLPVLRGRSFNYDSFEHGGVGKGTFHLSALWQQQMSAGFPLRAIFLPVVTEGSDSRLEECSAADALLALAPSTLAQLPVSGQTDCKRLALLADKLPAYRLYLGSDLEQIPALVKGFLG